MLKETTEKKLNNVVQYVCENLCKIPVNPGYTQATVERFCEKCRLNELVKDFRGSKEKICKEMDALYLAKCREVNELKCMLDRREYNG